MINFDELYRSQFKTQVKVMHRYVKDFDVAQDIVQESYVKALMYLSSYNPEKASPRTWFNMIMFNTLRNHKAGDMSAQNLEVDDDGNLVENVPQVDSFEKVRENFDLISGEIDLVKAGSSREILKLYYLLGYQSDEIAGALEINQSKVTSCCSRFKLKLMDKHNLII